MELLFILIIIGVIKSVTDSQRAKENSKSREAQRRPNDERLEDYQSARPQQPAKQTQEVSLEDFFGQMFGKAKATLAEMDERNQSAKPATQTATKVGNKPTQTKNKTKSKAKESQKAPAVASTRTEKGARKEHEKVSSRLKPVKNVFDDAQQCGHRIELNPNIRYSHPEQEVKRDQVAIKRDSESILQGVMWAEVLGKPKALQRR